MMNNKRALSKIAAEIAACPRCKQGGTGMVVSGEGSPEAEVVFIGEAPGKEEAKTGRPFVGRSGKFLRQAIADIGLTGDRVFITSPCHYLPLKGKPSKEAVVHGREHLFKQIESIDPRILVLLGSTACLAVLDAKIGVAQDHGRVIEKDGRPCLITFHPAYAMRFPEGRQRFLADFQKLKKLMDVQNS